MLIPLRSLWESTTTVAIPPAGRVFRGSPPLGIPILPSKGVAKVVGIEMQFETANVSASGGARIAVKGVNASFEYEMPTATGGANAIPDGSQSNFELGTPIVQGIGDDEEAIMIIFENL